MSDTGVIASPTSSKAPATMPDAVNISTPQANPGPVNPAAKINAPTLNSTNAPNVTGGKASFNDITQSIMDLANAKTAEASAGIDAYKSNVQIDQVASKGISGLTDDTLSALGNIQKAVSLPGGADGDIATILGLFNSDYNVNTQKSRIEINQTKATQITNTAAAIKAQNNELPSVLGKVSEAQKVIYDAQIEANKLALQGKQVDLEGYKTRLEAARLRLEMNADQRAQSKFTIDSLTTGQMETILPQAAAGKGKFAPLSGLIEHRLTEEKMAVTLLGKANNELSKGNRDEYNDSMIDAVSHMPQEAVAGLLAQSKSSGSPVVMMPTGHIDPTTKQPITLQIPYNLVEQGLIKSHAVEQQVNETLAAEQTQKLNIVPNIQNITNSAAAFASMDPRATQVLTNLSGVLKSYDPKNPMSVIQTGSVIAGYNTQMQTIAKENAAKFTTAEAKGAIENYGSTGKFDAAGGIAVMSDSGGIPGLAKSARYKGMWEQYNQMVAAELVKQGLVQGGMPQNSTDALSVMAMMMAKPNGRQTIAQVGAKLLADQTKSKPLQDAITGKIQSQSITSVVGQLASQKGADPMWAHILQHQEDYEDPTTGKFSVPRLFNAIEQATVINRANGKPEDMSQTFLRALRSYAANAEDSTAADPSYTVQDHAAEAALFGGNPAGNVLGNLHYQLRAIGAQARGEMNKRIQADITGQTQQDQFNKLRGFDLVNGIFTGDPQQIMQIFKKTGTDLSQVPSATGTGLSVSKIKQAYPSGAH